jgi:hypothetical protein
MASNFVFLVEKRALHKPPPEAPTKNLAFENILILSIVDKFSVKISLKPQVIK